MNNSKNMYDAWFDDILDDVRDNVLGEYWNKYLNYKYYREILKDLLHRSKLVHNHKYPSRSSVLHFNYGGDYELESPSNSVNHIEKYEVPENELNELHHVYYFIINHIVKTQGEEKNMLTESNDKQKEFLDKVVDRLLKESKYRFWEDKHDYTTTNKHEQHLKKIRVDIKFGLVNMWREDPIEYFDMKMVKDNLTKRRRKTEYLEDYERDQLTNIYGLNSDEIMGVIHKYYNSFYNNIYNSFLEMDEDDKIPTSKPEKWMRGDEVFDIGGRLDESYSEPKLEKIVNHFFNRIDFDDDKELVSIKDFTSQHGINTFLEYSSFCTWETLETYIPGKIMWVLEHIYGLNKREQLEAGYSINNLIRKKLNNCELKNRYNFNNYMSDEDYVKAIDNNTNKHLNESLSSDVNKDVDDLFSKNKKLTSEKKIKSIFMDKYGMNKQDADQAMVIYLSKQQSLNESIEKPKGMDLKYLFKVADSIMKEIELDDYDIPGAKMRGYGPWNDNSTGHYGFWTGLEKHAKDIYGLTQAETEMVSDLVWDSLNAKNIYLSTYIHSDERTKKHFGSLREQHYEDWDERSREQNINLLKAKGIDILSTDTNVPFYRRIDSKEIRFLNKVADMLIKQTKLVEADDISDFIVYAPFGTYELKVLLNEYRHYGFEKYVNNVYTVGDNQLIFPTHNSITQASEGQFLWEMYKDKLRRKQIQMVNPGLDIPDDAIITEQDLSNDDHKSLLKSFEVMDTPEEIASEELGNMIKWVKDLPEILFLYRVLYLDDVNDINYDELGSHYSQDRTDLINNHYDRGSIYGDMGEHAYLITVKVPKSEVDVMETLNNNILYPHEKEITLKGKGRGATYLDIEKI